MSDDDLQNLIQCMIIVSYVDGFDSEEFEVINEVFQEVWSKDKEDLDDLIEQRVKDVAGYNANGTMWSRFVDCVNELATSLDTENRDKVKSLIIKLIKADGKITGEETNMFLVIDEAFSTAASH